MRFYCNVSLLEGIANSNILVIYESGKHAEHKELHHRPTILVAHFPESVLGLVVSAE